MVATDSYRLSVKETMLEAPLEGGFEAERPGAGTAGAGADRAAADGETLTVGVRPNQVVFEVGGVVLSSRLIDGQFPNYRQLLPDTFEHELTLTGNELDRGRAPREPAGAEERAAAAVVSARAS